MKKLSKIFLVVIIMVTFIMNLSVFAVESDNKNNETNTSKSENISNEQKNSETSSNTANSQDSLTTDSTQNTNINKNKSATVTYDNSENQLHLSEILNILLIATGIVLILLSIAIFIKVK